MKTALIGYTGFVGGNIYNQLEFDDVYNSKNIKEIKGKKYDLVISAGVSAVKWLANQKPKEDWQNIEKLLNLLITAKIKYLVWISTVDVYPNPSDVDEKTYVDYKKAQPYGRNRFLAEEFIRKNFSFYSIVRLPGLFGFGIKKNLIFDIIHDQYNDFVHPESIFQFYNLKNIGSDLKIVIKNEIPLINFATEPISVQEIGRYVLAKKIEGNKNLKKVSYDMKTLYADFFNKTGDYLYKKDEILQEIKNFIEIEKSKL
jgi:nucleoside-diphosphate-sugar epimerase